MISNPPSAKEIIFSDLERELAVTRKVLERLPEEHFKWKPHAKSMAMGELAMHVANLVNWQHTTLAQDELDGAKMPPQRREANNSKDLLETFDHNVSQLREAVKRFEAANYGKTWTMRRGEQVMTSQPRALVYRVWSLNHMIHHRGQLCLYLRLLDVPVPTVYFNTADDPSWDFS